MEKAGGPEAPITRIVTQGDMMKKITMNDIARELGCSVAQVSRALAGKPKVAPEIRRQILELAQARNYRNCANCHVPKIAVLNNWYGEFSTGILNCLIRLSRQRKFHFVSISIESMALLNEQNFDGAISICSIVMARDWHIEFNIPLVVINSVPYFIEGIGAVVPDADDESRQAVEHLVGLGHRRIARIRCSFSTSRPATIGLRAFEEATEQFGIRGEVTQEFFHNYEVPEFRTRIAALLEQGFTAFIFVGVEACDTFFIPLLQSLGKRVPEDVSVIGYKSNPFTIENDRSALTRFSFDFHKLASNALELLFDELAGKAQAEQRLVRTPLIPGSSTGPAPETHNDTCPASIPADQPIPADTCHKRASNFIITR